MILWMSRNKVSLRINSSLNDNNPTYAFENNQFRFSSTNPFHSKVEDYSEQIAWHPQAFSYYGALWILMRTTQRSCSSDAKFLVENKDRLFRELTPTIICK